MRNPEGQGGLNTQPWPWRRPLPWDLVVPRLLRTVLQVSPPVSNGQCRSAECGWPTGPRSGKPCHRIHRAGTLAPQSGKPWDGTPSLIPSQDLLKTGQRAGEREKMKQSQSREERPGLLGPQYHVCLGRSLSSLGSKDRPGQVWSMGGKAWSSLGGGPGLKKCHKVCSTSLHEMRRASV